MDAAAVQCGSYQVLLLYISNTALTDKYGSVYMSLYAYCRPFQRREKEEKRKEESRHADMRTYFVVYEYYNRTVCEY